GAEPSGTAVVEGRDIEARDGGSAPSIAIVNEAFARKYFPVGRAVGRMIGGVRPGADEIQIVGVAANAVFRSSRFGLSTASLALRDPIPPTLYIPLAQSAGLGPPASTTLSISARTVSGDPMSLNRAIGTAITSVDDAVTYSFRLLEDQVQASMAQERLVAWLSAWFGGLALSLAALGLYGVT